MKIGSILTLIAASFLAVSQAQAQHNFEQWNGGNGTWDAGTTADWNGNQTWVNSIARDTPATPAVSTAWFASTPGTITIDNSQSSTNVTYGYMEFNSGSQAGNWVFNGGPISDVASDFTATVMQIDPGQTANVTFNATINIAPNPTNNGSLFYNQGNGTTLTIGNINLSNTPITYNDFGGPGNTPQTETTSGSGPGTFTRSDGSTYVFNSQVPLLFATNGNTIVLNGNYTSDPGLIGGMLIGNYGDPNMQNGTYIIKGGLDQNINGGKQFDFGSGNIIFDTSDTGTGPMVFVGAGANLPQTLMTGGAYTISNFIANQGASNAILGGKTADLSTFSGGINAGGSGGELTYRAAAGGRVIFSGNNSGDDSYTSKDGLGTVVLSSPTGNTFTSYDPTIAFEAKAGTTLITNTSGSAFGNSAKIVQVDSGATLGGTGISLQTVVAAGPGSIIAPGDAGQANLGIAASTGTLTLAGGLDTSNGGATLNFKINGLDNDKLSFASGDFLPTGTLTINLFNMGSQDSILSNHYYTLIDPSAGTLDPSGATVNIVAPYGYAVEDVQFGTFTGLEVELLAAPEPSTYALMLGGLGFLAFCIRRKNRASV